MSIREHLLLGDEMYGTLRTGCGREPTRSGGDYALGPSMCVREYEYVLLRQNALMRMCETCEASWRKICRDRNEPWTPTAREKAGTRKRMVRCKSCGSTEHRVHDAVCVKDNS